MEKKKGLGNGCPLYKKCGGCQLQNMTYDEQLSFKQAKVIKLLGKYCHVDEIIGMDDPYHYRNKVQAAFGTTRGGKVVSGVYQSSSHRIVDVKNCMLEDVTADMIIQTVKKLILKFNISIYNEDTRKGFLRHVLVKRGFTTNEIMVVIVAGTPVFKSKNEFLKKLLEIHPEITTVVLNVNNRHTSLVLGENEKVLYGDGYIKDVLCGCVFRISAKSFYQINPIQTEKLYNIAIDYASLTGKEIVLDAYCGIGTIGLAASKRAKNVIGVEINPEAVKDAIINAKLNKSTNTYFHNRDAGEFMLDMAKDKECVDVVFMDPPRAGSDRKFLTSITTLHPQRIVYVSCNPETLARDLALLVRNGYKVKKITPLDMFPHTSHVECVTLFTKIL